MLDFEARGGNVADIEPFAEVVGSEQVVGWFDPEKIVNLPPTQPDGSPWLPGGGRPVEEVLSKAQGDVFVMDLAPSAKEQLERRPDLSSEVRQYVDRECVEIDVSHFRGLSAGTRVRVGYKLTFTDPEKSLLGLDVPHER
jgi:hypothetical protein